MKPSILTLLSLSLLSLAFSHTAQANDVSTQAYDIKNILNNKYRDDNSARDQYRHPRKTLEFFEVKPTDSVVEIWPGNGWYAEILAPYLKSAGTYRAAHFDPESSVKFFRTSRDRFEQRIENEPFIFENTIMTTFAPPKKLDIAPKESVDKVLTFRNVHNWYMRGAGEVTLSAAFQGFYTALKPGGILGVVDHRLPEDRPDSEQHRSGYMKQSYVITIAERAGFILEAKSDINSNEKDSANHPNGVWTLPPRLKIDDIEKSKYKAIGESDRMTLKFRKPN